MQRILFRSRNLVVALLLFAPAALAAQSDETRRLDRFDAVSIGGAYDVEIRQGNAFSVQVSAASAEDLASVQTHVVDGTLKVNSDPKADRGWNMRRNIRLVITTDRLTRVSLGGSGDIRSDVTWKAEQFEVRVSGSGSVQLRTEATLASASVSGSGKIQLTGQSTKVDIGISGSGGVNTLELQAKDVDVRISGSGSAQVFAADNLDARCSGSGGIRYAGTPRISLSGGGSSSVKPVASR